MASMPRHEVPPPPRPDPGPPEPGEPEPEPFPPGEPQPVPDMRRPAKVVTTNRRE